MSDTKSGGEIVVPIIIKIKYANLRDLRKNAGVMIPILVKKRIITGKSKKNANGITKLNKKLKYRSAVNVTVTSSEPISVKNAKTFGKIK